MLHDLRFAHIFHMGVDGFQIFVGEIGVQKSLHRIGGGDVVDPFRLPVYRRGGDRHVRDHEQRKHHGQHPARFFRYFLDVSGQEGVDVLDPDQP